MSTKFLNFGTKMVLAFAIVALVFVQFGIAPKKNPVLAQSNDVWEFVLQSVADGSCFAPNSPVSISWTVKNAGSKPWVGYTFVGNNNTTSVLYTNLGQSASLTATFTTPAAIGSYKAEYSLKDEANNTVLSVNGSSTMWLDYVVSYSCNNTGSAESKIQNGDVQTAAGGHWEDVAEVSHQVCKWQTWFGCVWWEKVIDVPADRKWIPDPVATTPPPAPAPTAMPAVTQPPAQLAPPVGSCLKEGETQVAPSWTRVCLGGMWTSAVTDATGNTIVPVQAPTAPEATPIPAGAPTSFNGVQLPTTAGNVISGGGVMLYMYAGSMTLPANYVLVAEGTAYTTLSAAGTSVVSVVSACAMPLVIIGTAFFIAYGISALVAVPAAIIHPPAVAAQVAPMSLNVLVSQIPGYGVSEMYSSVVAMESLMQISLTNASQIEVVIPQTLLASGDKVITLPGGTTIFISYLESGGLCNHKIEMKFKFPWDWEIFQGFSEICGPWGLFEAAVQLLKNWSNRILQFWRNMGALKLTPEQIMALKSAVEIATDDLINFVISYRLYLLRNGW